MITCTTKQFAQSLKSCHFTVKASQSISAVLCLSTSLTAMPRAVPDQIWHEALYSGSMYIVCCTVKSHYIQTFAGGLCCYHKVKSECSYPLIQPSSLKTKRKKIKINKQKNYRGEFQI